MDQHKHVTLEPEPPKGSRLFRFIWWAAVLLIALLVLLVVLKRRARGEHACGLLSICQLSAENQIPATGQAKRSH